MKPTKNNKKTIYDFLFEISVKSQVLYGTGIGTDVEIINLGSNLHLFYLVKEI